MTARPAWTYADPARVYERAEARTCQGCESEDTLMGRKLCLKGKSYGRKCASYRERESNGKLLTNGGA